MRVEDIQVGKTYVGRKGKPRTVVSKIVRNGASYFRVVYHIGDPNKTFRCWCYTFAAWAKENSEAVEEATRLERLRAAAPEMYEALEAAEQILKRCPLIVTNDKGNFRNIGTYTALEEVRAALARARGESQERQP